MELARPGFELTTFTLEGENANRYRIYGMISLLQCIIFEPISYTEFILVNPQILRDHSYIT